MSTSYEEIKQRLLTMRDELSQREQALEHDRRHIDQPLDADSGERAVETENDEVLDALDQATLDQLRAINNALARIESGNYSSCSRCGEEISLQRLQTLPQTALCINCATQQEQ